MTEAARPPADPLSGSPAAGGSAASPPKPPPETPAARAGKILLALALFGVAAWLGNSRWTTATVDWHLGNIRQDPMDQEAYGAFARMGDAALPRLEEELQNADPNGRVVAVLALGQIKTPAAARLLASLAADRDPMVAAQSIAACGGLRDAETAKALSGALGDARRQVRLSARNAAVERSRGLPWWVFGNGSGKESLQPGGSGGGFSLPGRSGGS